MSYHTPAYLFVFLPIVLCVYQCASRKLRWIVLLASSYVFYWSISKQLIVFIWGTTLYTHFICLWMIRIRKQRAESDKYGRVPKEDQDFNKREKRILIFGIIILLIILGYMKYYNFFAENWNNLSDQVGHMPKLRLKDVIIPLGISFYTLQAISLMVDVYWKKTDICKYPGKTALFLSFFPTIMEGPICSYSQITSDLFKGEPIRYENLSSGSVRILWGLFKKLIIADRLNILVGSVYDRYESYSGPLVLAAAAAYTIQLYLEFSGCMDIVIGSSQMFGIRLPENFRQPFFAGDAAEFWRRWHISLGNWFRTYVFYPVSTSGLAEKWRKYAKYHYGRNTAKTGTMAIALFPVWLCNGIWHGPRWSFIFYGMYYYCILLMGMILAPFRESVLQKLYIRKEATRYRTIQIMRTWVIILIGELFFRAEGLAVGMKMFISIFKVSPGKITINDFLSLGLDQADYLAVLVGCFVVMIVDIIKEKRLLGDDGIQKLCLPVRWSLYYALILSVVIFGAYGIGYEPVDLIYAGF